MHETQWLEMGLAPKGKTVLLYLGEGRIVSAYYHEGECFEDGDCDISGWMCPMQTSVELKPKFWAPLPTPPSPEGALPEKHAVAVKAKIREAMAEMPFDESFSNFIADSMCREIDTMMKGPDA